MTRLLAKGKVTNYEMGWLRKNAVWRKDTRWNHLWASLSTSKHPVSKEHWEELQEDK